MQNRKLEFSLLGLLALLWGSSYLFIKIAVAEIPPVTLVAIRVSGAAVFLLVVLWIRRERLPREFGMWRMLGVQAFFNSIAAWVVLAWGQQFVDSGLASVLNSTAPIFVFMITAFVTQHEHLSLLKITGALIGTGGVILIVGINVLSGLGMQVLGQIACVLGAILYACGAIYGKRFSSLGAVVTATCTMLWASVVLIPFSLVLDKPWLLSPSVGAIAATAILSILCTGAALMIYFRLLGTLGSMGVASQAYLRAAVGVLLGIIFLGESLTLSVFAGLLCAMLGVAMINWPISTESKE